MQIQPLLILTIAQIVYRPSLAWMSLRRTNKDNIEYTDSEVMKDERLRTPELLTKYGYPVEVHHVITDDGYILELHRIPKNNGIPVLLVHGLLDASSTWILMGPQQGFAYMLSDQNYDVWMANVRGNTYCKNHTTLDPRSAAFWHFTFHEMGIYDIPATIDFVLERTGFKKLHYIGHSQGCTCFLIMCSQRPEYNDKIISMQAMAPAVYIKECKSPLINFLAVFRYQIYILLQMLGTYEFLPSGHLIEYLSENVCQNGEAGESLCSDVLFLITGFNKAQMNNTMLPVILGHTPAGASTRQLLHFSQFKYSGIFRQFDHGVLGNIRRYGRSTPPAYNLRKVTSKVAIYYGANDWLTVPSDIEKLNKALPNVVGKFLVKFADFNHMDFIWGIDARELLHRNVVKSMKKFE